MSDIPVSPTGRDPDDSHILDAPTLESMGRTSEEIDWLLAHAVRGSSVAPYLLPDEYERLLPDLDGRAQ
jgi:hypothetical protein